MKVTSMNKNEIPTPDEANESVEDKTISKKELKNILISIDGLGEKKYIKIIDEIGGTNEVVGVLDQSPSILLNIKGITKKLVDKINKKWDKFRNL
jgi:ERCC4-type nuclease